MSSILNLLAPFAWPLAALVAFAVGLVWLYSDIKPITVALIKGLAAHAGNQSGAYAFGFLLATAASLQAMQEVAHEMSWVYVGAAAKVIQPGLVAVIAFIRPSPAQAASQQQPPQKP